MGIRKTEIWAQDYETCLTQYSNRPETRASTFKISLISLIAFFGAGLIYLGPFPGNVDTRLPKNIVFNLTGVMDLGGLKVGVNVDIQRTDGE